MTYCCTDRRRPKEASCICTRLPVTGPAPDSGLGYWPAYSEMRPAQRGRYLRWLADGKRAYLDDIGYAFVYFYGLERRALIDGQDDLRIMDEVRRLLARYPESRSFRKYLGGFLALLYAKNLENPAVTEERLLDLHGFSSVPRKTSFLLLLGWYALNNIALSPEQAFYVLRNLPPSKGADTSFPPKFRDLFYDLCRRTWPSGFSLSASSKKCRVEYGVASGTLSFDGRSKSPLPVEIPNVLGKMSQFKKLLAIREFCLKGDEGELVLTRRAGERVPGEALPRRGRGKAKPAPPQPPVEIVIDAERLARLREETESLSLRLAGIFEQDELRDEPTKPVAGDTKDRKGESATEAADPSDSPSSDLPFSDLPFSAAALKRLDPKYAPVLYALLEREGRNAEPWSREEWSALARRHGFMPNALIEELNTWGEEALGDFLLFDDDDGPVLNRDVWN